MIEYQGKKLKFIKDYGNWILFENDYGWKEGINKHDLGLIKPRPRVYNISPENKIIV